MQLIRFKIQQHSIKILTDLHDLHPSTDTINYYKCRFDLDDEWESYDEVSLIFKNASSNVVIRVPFPDTYECFIPYEVLANTGVILIGAVGIDVSIDAIDNRITTEPSTIFVQVEEGLIEGDPSATPTPTEYEAFVANVISYSNASIAAKNAAQICATTASNKATEASGYATNASTSASASQVAANNAATNANRAEVCKDKIEDMTVSAEGSAAGTTPSVTKTETTESFNLHFVIPKGDKGDTGTTAWNDITGKPDTFPPDPHNHDSRYYTESEVDALISDFVEEAPIDNKKYVREDGDWSEISTSWNDITGKPDTFPPSVHTHDDRYYTETEVNTLLGNKANVSDVEAIEVKIPAQATSSNKLADKDFVNSSINSVTAYYITKNANGDQFNTHAELLAATTFYSGGEVRVPTRNDYCIVLVDEDKQNATTRYIYQNNQWEYQYTVNETALTSDQLKAINSGITDTLVGSYNTHIADSNIHVTTLDKSTWSAKYDKPASGIPASDLADTYTEEAPNDNKQYVRKNEDWEEVEIPEVQDATKLVKGLMQPYQFMTQAEVDAIDNVLGSDVADNFSQIIYNLVYPVGSVYETSNTLFNPNDTFVGTWVKIEGKVLVGLDIDDTDFDTVGETGGAKGAWYHTHTITLKNTETAGVAASTSKACASGSAFYSAAGTVKSLENSSEGSANNTLDVDVANMPPYEVVVIWKRTA